MAELENADLSASAESSKGEYENCGIELRDDRRLRVATAATEGRTGRRQRQSRHSKRSRKIYESRKELLQQGAIPRRDVDAAEVALAQARSQNEQAQKQLADLQRLGKDQL